MAKKLFIFEDDKFENFYPLAYSRPVYQLLSGLNLIRDKITSFYPESEVTLLCRDYLKDVLTSSSNLKVNSIKVKDEDELLFINGRVTASAGLPSMLKFSQEKKSYTYKTDLIGFTFEGRDLRQVENEVNSLYQKASLESIKNKTTSSEVEVEVVDYLWNLVDRNKKEIESDFKRLSTHLDFKNMFKNCEVDNTVIIYNLKDVFIGKGTRVDAHVVLDAREGPIYIDERVKIKSHTRVEGPVYIGKETQLVGGKIEAGCSFGSLCKVGGEVENSIFLGFSNKYHQGFLGHSYIGEWVNLGALTTNSDLKNNYSRVRVQLNDKKIDTELIKVGCFLGDHVKTGIGTLLNTGINVGFGSNLFSGRMIKEKFVPSFSWFDGTDFQEYRLEKFLSTASEVMKRRGKKLKEEEINLFKVLFDSTKEEREAVVKIE